MENFDDSSGNCNDDIVEVIEEDDDDVYHEGSDDDVDNEDMYEEDSDTAEDSQEGDDDEDMDVPDDADLTFTQHTSSIFCCDLEPTFGTLAVSGGEDDCAVVWSTVDGESMFKADHKDSVTCVCFSHDGKLVATGDMSGYIQVWDVADKKQVWDFEADDLCWLDWHHSSHVLMAGMQSGDIFMWKVPGGDCKTFPTHGFQTSCAKILPDGRRAVAGYADGSVKLWGLKEAKALYHIKDNFGHKEEVLCIDSSDDGNLVLSGSMDGTAKLINTTTGRVVNTIGSPRTDLDDKSCLESVGFCPTGGLFATGNLSGSLCIYDLSTQVQRLQCKHDSGIVRLIWDYASPLIYTGALDGCVRLWDARTGALASKWSGHTRDLLDMKLSRDGGVILTASDDHTCKLFHVTKPDR